MFTQRLRAQRARWPNFRKYWNFQKRSNTIERKEIISSRMCCIGALLLRYYGYFCRIDTTRTYRYIETEKNGLLNSTNSLWRYLHEIVQQCTWHVFLFQPALFNNKKYLRRGCKLLTQVKIINNIFSISCKLPKETMSAFTRRNNFFLTKVCVWSLWISKKKKSLHPQHHDDSQTTTTTVLFFFCITIRLNWIKPFTFTHLTNFPISHCWSGQSLTS